MSIIIRQATSNDLDYLLQAGEKLFEAEREYEPLLKYSTDEALSRYSSEIDNPDCLFLVALDGDKNIGYAYAHLNKIDYLDTDKKMCELEAVFVEDGYRKMGVASRLTEEVIDWAKKKKASRVRAGVFSGNEPSLNFFKKLKFSKYHQSLYLDLD